MLVCFQSLPIADTHGLLYKPALLGESASPYLGVELAAIICVVDNCLFVRIVLG